MRSHMNVYFNFEEVVEALTDDEKGRLLLTMVRYAKTGIVPEMTGNERLLFPALRCQIDRDIEAYETKVANGNRGGRPRKYHEPEKTENNQEKPEETENNQTKPNETETGEDRRKKIEDRRKKIEDRKMERFTPPTLEQVREYCRERGRGVDPDRWFNYYSANGWKVGKNPMKDFRAAIRTWESPKPVNAQQYSQRDYKDDEWDRENTDRVLKILQGDMMA